MFYSSNRCKSGPDSYTNSVMSQSVKFHMRACGGPRVHVWSLDDKVPEHVLILRYVFCLIYVRVY